MVDVLDLSELRGWVIEKRRSHYSLGYWVLFVLGMFGQSVPPPPEITYTLRNSSSGEFRVATLPGDHARSDLIEAVAHPQNGNSTENGLRTSSQRRYRSG